MPPSRDSISSISYAPKAPNVQSHLIDDVVQETHVKPTATMSAQHKPCWMQAPGKAKRGIRAKTKGTTSNIARNRAEKGLRKSKCKAIMLIAEDADR